MYVSVENLLKNAILLGKHNRRVHISLTCATLQKYTIMTQGLIKAYHFLKVAKKCI